MRPGRTDLEENLRTSKSKKLPTTLPWTASRGRIDVRLLYDDRDFHMKCGTS